MTTTHQNSSTSAFAIALKSGLGRRAIFLMWGGQMYYDENGDDDSSAVIWLIDFSSQLRRLLSGESDFKMNRAFLWNF
jgi:hypothetical protein